MSGRKLLGGFAEMTARAVKFGGGNVGKCTLDGRQLGFRSDRHNGLVDHAIRRPGIFQSFIHLLGKSPRAPRMSNDHLKEPKNPNIVAGLEKKLEFFAVGVEVVSELIPHFVETEDMAVQKNVVARDVYISSFEPVSWFSLFHSYPNNN